MPQWGRFLTCGPVSNRPLRARPSEVASLGHQARSHWIVFDVGRNAFEFPRIAHDVVIALILPEGLACQAEQPIGRKGGEAFQRMRNFGDLYVWRDQQMNVIGHHNVSVELIEVQVILAVMNCVYSQSGYFRATQVKGARVAAIENGIHRDEGLAGSEVCWECAIRRQAAVQPPGDEGWLFFEEQMRQAAAVESFHK